jgi:CDP-diacylglycerol--glycerol-3-phosphate 3-phosphatidyltransferase
MSGRDPALRFHRGILVLAGLYLLILAAGAALTSSWPHPESAARGAWWALKTGAVLAWQLGYLLVNRRRALEGENLQHLWGPANSITVARGVLLALLAGYLFAPEPLGLLSWLPALIYVVAAVADFLDGFWAKRTGTHTRLGALLDGEMDGVGILAAVALAVQYGRLPAPFLVLGLAKPAYAVGLGLHRLLGGSIHDLPPSYLRRRLAGFQMGIVAVSLWPIAGHPVTTLAQVLVGLPFLAGFLRDGLAAAGLIDPGHPAYQRWKGRLGRLAFGWGPRVLRAAAGAVAALRVALAVAARVRGGDALAAWRTAGLLWPPAGRPTAAAAAAALQLLALAIMAAGVPRCAVYASALVFLLVEGLRAFQGRLDVAGAVSLSAALLLYVLRPARRPP